MRRCLLLIAIAGLAALWTPNARAQTLADDLNGLSDEQIEDTVEFAFGNALFFLFHEAGHMLVSEFNLPVLGREEDAVDTLSTLLLLEADDEVFDTALIDSVDGWVLSADEADEAEREQILWGAHGLDRQRAFNMVCLMVGRNADKFKESADDLEVPERRRQECVAEFRKAHDSWFGVLKPHIRTDSGKTKFTITYKTPKSDNLKDYAELTKEAKVLDILAELLSGLYKLEDGIKLTAAECGEPNAYWSAGAREATYCYELMQWHSQAIAKYFRSEAETADGQAEADAEDADQGRPALKNVFNAGAARP